METIERYLQKNQERFVDELCEYVRFPSVSAQPQHRKDLQACAEWLCEHCRHIGLEANLHPTDGNPVLIAKTPGQSKGAGKAKGKPHFVVYGHYDVQPPEPFELWNSPPFEARIVGRSIFGRGASDNKGQNLAHLKAVEAYLKTGTELPCDVTFMIEGEEEVGSKHLADFLRAHRAELACGAFVISDTGIPSLKFPALTYSLRGIAALEIKVSGPNRDLHSGLFGGSVDNPAMVLCELLAGVRDRRGRIRIPGFYDHVAKMTAFERRQLARVPFNQNGYRKFLGVPRLFGEAGYTPNEQRSSRPTFEINGMTSGYQGHGSKTIVPAWASAKITMRLVPDQDPETIRKIVVNYFKKICPPTVRIEFQTGHGGEPYFVSPQSPRAQSALRALRKAFKREPVLQREGGSIPIVNDFKKILGVDTLLVGLALPDDNAHSPNEKFSLDAFEIGQRLGVHLWQELAIT